MILESSILIFDVAISLVWVFVVYEFRKHKYHQLDEYENYLNQTKEELKKFQEINDKGIENINEILETLTNDSKAKIKLLNDINNVQSQNTTK